MFLQRCCCLVGSIIYCFVAGTFTRKLSRSLSLVQDFDRVALVFLACSASSGRAKGTKEKDHLQKVHAVNGLWQQECASTENPSLYFTFDRTLITSTSYWETSVIPFFFAFFIEAETWQSNIVNVLTDWDELPVLFYASIQFFHSTPWTWPLSEKGRKRFFFLWRGGGVVSVNTFFMADRRPGKEFFWGTIFLALKKKKPAFGVRSMFRKAKSWLMLLDMILHVYMVFVEISVNTARNSKNLNSKKSQQRDTGHGATGVCIFSCAPQIKRGWKKKKRRKQKSAIKSLRPASPFFFLPSLGKNKIFYGRVYFFVPFFA